MSRLPVKRVRVEAPSEGGEGVTTESKRQRREYAIPSDLTDMFQFVSVLREDCDEEEDAPSREPTSKYIFDVPMKLSHAAIDALVVHARVALEYFDLESLQTISQARFLAYRIVSKLHRLKMDAQVLDAAIENGRYLGYWGLVFLEVQRDGIHIDKSEATLNLKRMGAQVLGKVPGYNFTRQLLFDHVCPYLRDPSNNPPKPTSIAYTILSITKHQPSYDTMCFEATTKGETFLKQLADAFRINPTVWDDVSFHMRKKVPSDRLCQGSTVSAWLWMEFLSWRPFEGDAPIMNSDVWTSPQGKRILAVHRPPFDVVARLPPAARTPAVCFESFARTPLLNPSVAKSGIQYLIDTYGLGSVHWVNCLVSRNAECSLPLMEVARERRIPNLAKVAIALACTRLANCSSRRYAHLNTRERAMERMEEARRIVRALDEDPTFETWAFHPQVQMFLRVIAEDRTGDDIEFLVPHVAKFISQGKFARMILKSIEYGYKFPCREIAHLMWKDRPFETFLFRGVIPARKAVASLEVSPKELYLRIILSAALAKDSQATKRLLRVTRMINDRCVVRYQEFGEQHVLPNF